MLTKIHNISKIYTWNPSKNSLDIYKNKELLIKDGVISSINSKINIDVDKNIDANQAIITPGFIDSHTHPIFSGNRSNEFIKRLSGVSYQKIKEDGGGIAATINSTIESDFKTIGRKRSLFPFLAINSKGFSYVR